MTRKLIEVSTPSLSSPSASSVSRKHSPDWDTNRIDNDFDKEKEINGNGNAPQPDDVEGRKRGASETPLPGSSVKKCTKPKESISSSSTISKPPPKHNTPHAQDTWLCGVVALESIGTRFNSFEQIMRR